MSSAFKTFMSAAGVGSACYLLAMATWDQVLLLFLLSSFGWCLYSAWASNRKPAPIQPMLVKKAQKITGRNAVVSKELVAPPAAEPPRKVYKFPIHELAGAPIPRTIQAFE